MARQPAAPQAPSPAAPAPVSGPSPDGYTGVTTAAPKTPTSATDPAQLIEQPQVQSQTSAPVQQKATVAINAQTLRAAGLEDKAKGFLGIGGLGISPTPQAGRLVSSRAIRNWQAALEKAYPNQFAGLSPAARQQKAAELLKGVVMLNGYVQTQLEVEQGWKPGDGNGFVERLMQNAERMASSPQSYDSFALPSEASIVAAAALIQGHEIPADAREKLKLQLAPSLEERSAAELQKILENDQPPQDSKPGSLGSYLASKWTDVKGMGSSAVDKLKQPLAATYAAGAIEVFERQILSRYNSMQESQRWNVVEDAVATAVRPAPRGQPQTAALGVTLRANRPATPSVAPRTARPAPAPAPATTPVATSAPAAPSVTAPAPVSGPTPTDTPAPAPAMASAAATVASSPADVALDTSIGLTSLSTPSFGYPSLTYPSLGFTTFTVPSLTVPEMSLAPTSPLTLSPTFGLAPTEFGVSSFGLSSSLGDFQLATPRVSFTGLASNLVLNSDVTMLGDIDGMLGLNTGVNFANATDMPLPGLSTLSYGISTNVGYTSMGVPLFGSAFFDAHAPEFLKSSLMEPPKKTDAGFWNWFTSLATSSSQDEAVVSAHEQAVGEMAATTERAAREEVNVSAKQARHAEKQAQRQNDQVRERQAQVHQDLRTIDDEVTGTAKRAQERQREVSRNEVAQDDRDLIRDRGGIKLRAPTRRSGSM